MELDDEAGARLRALADSERGELDAAAQARIAARVAQRGPGIVRRARRTRTALQLAAGLCVVGMAWGASRWIAPLQNAQEVAEGVAPSARPVASATPPSAAVAAEPACRQRPARESELIADSHETAQRFGLDPLGTVLAESGSASWVDASDPCRVRVQLLSGKVLVHAEDLGGGELRVVTDRGTVVVHGTMFAVTREGSELTVEVAEGRVAVVQHGRALVPELAGGQRARIVDGQAPRVEPLPASERDALLARFSASAARPELEPAAAAAAVANGGTRAGGAGVRRRSASSLVQEADALWHGGQLELARARYREAGSQQGPTAEAAWLALARRELSAGRAADAQQALQGYAARFPRGALVAEATGIAFRVALVRGDVAGARQRAELLTRKYPKTAQADAAARWLARNPPP
jgi:hypothetical protein